MYGARVRNNLEAVRNGKAEGSGLGILVSGKI